MNNKRFRITFICVLLIVAMVCVTTSACNDKTSTPALTPMSEVTLSNDHVLRWQPIEGALYYSLRVDYDDTNGFEIPVNNTEYVLKLYKEGTYTLRVRPRFTTGFGAYCEPITYVVATEVVVTPSEDGKITLRGAGTKDDPLLIYNREELASLTDGLRDVEEDGTTVRKQNYYRLMADIDLGDAEWTSIGSSAKPFEGIFDGNNYTIRGLKQTKLNGGTLKRNGLFSTLSKAVIVNLNLEDVGIALGLITEDCSIGGLAGYCSGTTVENCSVQGTIRIDSPQTGKKKCYVGMVVGYSSGTAMRRVSTAGNIDATYSAVFAGGMAGICTAPETDSMNNCISRVNVRAEGTGTNGNNPAGRAYAAGFAYISNTSGIANCVWLGSASCSVKVGTLADEDMYYEGMFVQSSTQTVKGQSNIALVDCFYDIAGIVYDEAAFDAALYESETARRNAIAKRYIMGGATSQKSTSAVYGVDAATRAQMSTYRFEEGTKTVGLDFDSVWEMGEDGPRLAAYHSEWFTVQFVLDDGTVVSTQNILKGQTATLPTYVGAEGYAVQWDLAAATPIESDMQIKQKHE